MIELFHVYKSYQEGFDTLADINLFIGKGEFVFLTGASGAGKTTLLRLINCTEKATSGQVLIRRKNLAKLEPASIPYIRREVGVVFQDFKLIPRRSVFDNVALPLEVMGEAPTLIKQKVMEVLKSVGLIHKATQLPMTMSGGEQQRVAIARAIVNSPYILLADEPTGNLDPGMTEDIFRLLMDINARGTTVLVATHDKTILERYHFRTLTLERGRIIRDRG
ncbi:MAG: cell division ATP-binding protein FtsE [Myxococcota bacterium]